MNCRPILAIVKCNLRPGATIEHECESERSIHSPYGADSKSVDHHSMTNGQDVPPEIKDNFEQVKPKQQGYYTQIKKKEE